MAEKAKCGRCGIPLNAGDDCLACENDEMEARMFEKWRLQDDAALSRVSPNDPELKERT